MRTPDHGDERGDPRQPDTGERRRKTDALPLARAESVIRRAASEQRLLMRLTSLGWAFLGLLLILSAMGFLLNDEVSRSSAIHDQLPDTAEKLWSIGWLVAGGLLIYGSLRPARMGEVLGHIILLGALMPYGTAILTRFGPGFAFWLVIGFAVFSSLRMFYLLRYAGRIQFVLGDEDRD